MYYHTAVLKYLLSVHCADITVGVGCETHGLSQVFSICVCVCVCVCVCACMRVKGRTEICVMIF